MQLLSLQKSPKTSQTTPLIIAVLDYHPFLRIPPRLGMEMVFQSRPHVFQGRMQTTVSDGRRNWPVNLQRRTLVHVVHFPCLLEASYSVGFEGFYFFPLPPSCTYCILVLLHHKTQGPLPSEGFHFLNADETAEEVNKQNRELCISHRV